MQEISRAATYMAPTGERTTFQSYPDGSVQITMSHVYVNGSMEHATAFMLPQAVCECLENFLADLRYTQYA